MCNDKKYAVVHILRHQDMHILLMAEMTSAVLTTAMSTAMSTAMDMSTATTTAIEYVHYVVLLKSQNLISKRATMNGARCCFACLCIPSTNLYCTTHKFGHVSSVEMPAAYASVGTPEKTLRICRANPCPKMQPWMRATATI